MTETSIKAHFLITTADEKTWEIKQPVLFLGEWCHRFDRKATWENLDSEVVPYHWDNREKLYNDYITLSALYEKLLIELTSKLNEFHKVNHSLRYWRILIGPWLGYFTQMLFDRWTMIERVCSNYKIIRVKVLNTPLVEIVPNDMDHFIRLFVTDKWNEAIFNQLIQKYTKLPVENLLPTIHSKSLLLNSTGFRTNQRITLKHRINKSLMNFISWGSKFFVKSNEAFLITTYLPLKQDLHLQLILGQFPKIWHSYSTPSAELKLLNRGWKLCKSDVSGFEHIIREMIPEHLPTAYLEGFTDLMNLQKKLPWPTEPKFIFTSNSFSSDDVFKAWAALKVEGGTPLVIGQHGGNYGLARWSFNEDHQVAISDAYISWGWEDLNSPRIKKFGNLKTIRKKQNWNPKGYAMLVEMTLPQYSYWMYSAPVAHQWLDYFEDQCRFTAALSTNLRSNLLIRLYSQDYGWCQKKRWLDRFPNIRLDDGTASISSLIENSRLYISTYNATTFLDSLSMNVPTIMFWNPKHWELREEARPYFNRLKEVGIFHETPESAAAKVVEIWDSVSCWWNQPEIQEAREYFCKRFARTVKNPTKLLKDILLSAKA